jgi:hypothetical protein
MGEGGEVFGGEGGLVVLSQKVAGSDAENQLFEKIQV